MDDFERGEAFEELEDDGYVECVTLTDEEGQEFSFAILDTFEMEGKEYAILLQLPEDLEERENQYLDEDDLEDVMVVEVQRGETEEDTLYNEVEDEDLYDQILQMFAEVHGLCIEDEEEEE